MTVDKSKRICSYCKSKMDFGELVISTSDNSATANINWHSDEQLNLGKGKLVVIASNENLFNEKAYCCKQCNLVFGELHLKSIED